LVPPTPQPSQRHPASFRDPNGFIDYGEDGDLLRQVNRSYEADYRRLMESGLFAELTSHGLLVDHEDFFPDYHQAGFESAFRQYFDVEQSQPIGQDGRVLYRMTGRV
jgi:hypothetical protein